MVRSEERLALALGIFSLLSVSSGCADEGPRLAGPPDGSHDVDGGTDAGTPPDATLIHAPSGLPCDVETLLGTNCTICHTQPPQTGAPFPLLTHAQLTAVAAPTTMTYAQLCVTEMTAGRMPPPPTPRATAAEIAVLQDWITAGMPAGTTACTDTTPYDGASTCTSGTHWTQGDDSSPDMHPGGACLACHSTASSPPDPIGTMAGTVYPSIHEPDDCNGVPGTTTDPIVVSVLDRNRQTITATVTASGNFFASSPVALPIRSATVTYQGRTRTMASAQVSADCNSCHTEGGTLGAPGRILLP
jgi:hypothetical protein